RNPMPVPELPTYTASEYGRLHARLTLISQAGRIEHIFTRSFRRKCTPTKSWPGLPSITDSGSWRGLLVVGQDVAGDLELAEVLRQVAQHMQQHPRGAGRTSRLAAGGADRRPIACSFAHADRGPFGKALPQTGDVLAQHLRITRGVELAVPVTRYAQSGDYGPAPVLDHAEAVRADRIGAIGTRQVRYPVGLLAAHVGKDV